jgi:hypothetical protein
MTRRQGSPSGSDIRHNQNSERARVRASAFAAALRRVRIQVAAAQLAGELSPGERRALTALIASVARLLEATPPDSG